MRNSLHPPIAHRSVFLEEFSSFFASQTLRCFVDATLGAGGHSERILKTHPELECWIGIDQDSSALELARDRLLPLLGGKRAHFLHSSFAQAVDSVRTLAPTIDGAFFDLGVSSMQLDQPQRGFSFRFEGPLDMRMDRSQRLDAASIVNEWPAKQLEQLFHEFGEEPRARKAADLICTARRKKRIESTLELAQALEGLWHSSRKHPATRVFQALRIAVNQELQQLEQALPAWIELLSPGGRLGVISFHSLEDRIVKLQMRSWAKEVGGKLLTPKPLEPSRGEVRLNPRARSAKLRFIEKNFP